MLFIGWRDGRIVGKEGAVPPTTCQESFSIRWIMKEMSIPATMRAVAIDRHGPSAVLKLRTLPIPSLGPRDVLIALHTAGVGIRDAKIREGSRASGRERFPLVLGTDGAGFVAAKGARVRRFDIGDRVFAYQPKNSKGGFYAEYVAIDDRNVARAPQRLDWLEAGAAASTALAALKGIDEILRVRKGETVLVFGASGGVGTLAVQFACRRGARVIASASCRDAAVLLRGLGAHEVVDVRSAGSADRLRALAPGGIDAMLALAGGDELERCVDALRPGGRIAYPNGVEPPHRRGITKTAYDAIAGSREFARLARAITESHLRVPIAAVFPLAQAAKAHARRERDHVMGRIVLRIRRQIPRASALAVAVEQSAPPPFGF